MSRRDDLVSDTGAEAYAKGYHAGAMGRGADYCTGETMLERIYWLLGRQDALIAQEAETSARGMP